MRFYRLHRQDVSEGSQGYEWFTALETAQIAKMAWIAEDPLRAENTETVAIEITPTKAGILDALNKYASHADNG